MKIAYYISGHGYGHAVRSVQVIEQLLQKQPDLQVEICTAAPEWLFAQFPRDRISIRRVQLDVGAVQADSFSIDIGATFKANRDLYTNEKKLLKTEQNFLLDSGIAAVISDITAPALSAAHAAAIPAFAVGNFSWDWIYAAWQKDYPEFTAIVQRLQAAYAQTDLLFRLPFHGDLGIFPRIQDVGLISRKSKLSAKRVRRLLALDPEQRLLLVGLRVQDLQRVDWQQLELGSWRLLSTAAIPHERAIRIHEGILPFEDILTAVDAVISKPGYGMVSDVLANRTPLVYVPRQDFVEDPILCEALEKHAVSKKLSRTDFWAGRWHSALQELQESSKSWGSIDLRGAEQIAAAVLQRLKS